MNPAAKREQQTGSEERATDSGGLRKMIDEQQLLERIPMSRSTLHRLQKKDRFPKGVYLSENRKFYFLDDIVRWQNTVNEFNPNRKRGQGRRRRVSPSAS
jgi:prophage regulatory protein